MNEPTMQDVANVAGVGVATVDRVINRRARVRPETAQRVLDAAEQVGFRRTGLIQKRIDEHTSGYRLGFILQKTTLFYEELGQALTQATGQPNTALGKSFVVYLEDITPESVAKALYKLAEKVDAIAVVAADHPIISQAISRIQQKGVPVFALISDLSAPDCAGYVSVDHRLMGRSAAWTMAHLQPAGGKIGLMLGSHRYLCQEQAEISFRSYMREFAPQFDVLETMVNLEDSRLAEQATLDLLKRHQDLVGIYVAGGGIEGVVRGLKETAETMPVTICHDLTAHSRQALIDGQLTMVLAHPNAWMATSLVEALCETLRSKSNRTKRQVILPHVTYTAANV